ncbi:MAG TPA: hypothetical protein VM889_08415 [Candidatus Thermoplasmatota archaeon]|nr:hypothetical protein [Candidatus Thermoplasmatota archaeon]
MVEQQGRTARAPSWPGRWTPGVPAAHYEEAPEDPTPRRRRRAKRIPDLPPASETLEMVMATCGGCGATLPTFARPGQSPSFYCGGCGRLADGGLPPP